MFKMNTRYTNKKLVDVDMYVLNILNQDEEHDELLVAWINRTYLYILAPNDRVIVNKHQYQDWKEVS